MSCEQCGHEMEIGDYPFCNGSKDDHVGPTSTSGSMDPVVVHHNKVTGEFQFPGRTDDAVPRGYDRVEIKSMREYERFRRQWETRETETVHNTIRESRADSEDRAAYRRERLRPIADKLGSQARARLETLIKRRDQMRNEKFDKLLRRTPQVNVRVLEFDGRRAKIVQYER